MKIKTKQKTNAKLYDDTLSSSKNLVLLKKQSQEVGKPET